MTNANQSNNKTNKTAGSAHTRSSNVPVSETQNQTPDIPALDGAEGEKTMKNQQQPGFWATVKTAFAWGLGGSFGAAIGWRLGNFVMDLFGKVWRWAVLLGGSYLATHGGLQSIREALF